jgi:hypothetical protein
MYTLRRSSGEDLALTREHDAIALPRKGTIDWASFRADAFAPDVLARAAAAWAIRATQEMHSLALFTELAGHIHRLGAPLDWSGAFARMIADEVRHTDLCLRMAEALGATEPPEVDPDALHLLGARPSRAGLRQTVIAAFCVGETLSGRMFRRALRAVDVPVARDVVAAILVDETFHGELGWELGALLMRDDGGAFGAERESLAASLPALFRHFAAVATAEAGPSWARGAPETDPGPNFGTLSHAGYARAFFDGMEEDVVPGLEAIGLPEARAAYDALVVTLEAR